MTRPGRILSVTIGLVAAGAVLGAFAGAVALSASVLITENDTSGDGLMLGAFFGAPLGAIMAPVLSWTLLRRVPLGRMFMGLVAGTAAGGVVAWITTTSTIGEGPNGLAGAFIGCVVAAVTLRARLEA